MRDDDSNERDDDRVSLAPLDPEEALRALLKVDPESEPAEHNQQWSGLKPEPPAADQ